MEKKSKHKHFCPCELPVPGKYDNLSKFFSKSEIKTALKYKKPSYAIDLDENYVINRLYVITGLNFNRFPKADIQSVLWYISLIWKDKEKQVIDFLEKNFNIKMEDFKFEIDLEALLHFYKKKSNETKTFAKEYQQDFRFLLETGSQHDFI